MGTSRFTSRRGPALPISGAAQGSRDRGSLPLSLIALVIALAAPSWSQTEPWSIEDLVSYEEVSDLTLSRDGGIAAWILSSVVTLEGKEERVARVWMARLDGGEPRPLTRGRERSAAPVFSPGGRHLAFLSDRELPKVEAEDAPPSASTQIWIVPLSGGEPYPLTRFDGPVVAVDWIDDRTVVALAPEALPAVTRARRRDEDDSLVVEDAQTVPPVRLFAIGLEDTHPRRLTTNDTWIDLMTVSPDGRRAVVREQRSLSWEYDQRIPPRTSLVDLRSGEMRSLFGDERLVPSELAWTPKADAVYFLAERSTHPTYQVAVVRELWHCDLAGGNASPVAVDLDWQRGASGGLASTSVGALVLLADGVVDRPALFERGDATWSRSQLSGIHSGHIDEWMVSPDGKRVVYVTSTANTPPQLWTARLEGLALVDEQRLGELNPGYAHRKMARVEVLRVRGAGGDEVEALLHYPMSWREGSPAPLVLDIHGGPLGRDRNRWEGNWHEARLLVQERGAFVLQVNYHGSDGYGLEWAESIGGGRYYELEIPDIEAAVDRLVARGLADPERLAVTGWSNGGILAAELITRTHRYRAAVIGAADVEWISDWANVDFGASFDNYYFGASPFADPELYVEKSPFFRLPAVRTPTLVLTGTADRNVPPAQSWNLFRALQQETTTPVRLVLFPDEPHGLRQIPHQRRKLEEEMRWLDLHLFDNAPRRSPAIPEGSPLATLLDRAAAARTHGELGRDADGTLVPETVPFGDLEVGRFEVTRSQYRAFAPDSRVDPGEGELPITGLSFEEAGRYAAWLARITGRPFRLPTAAEAERLADRAGRRGNTLDRWLGYAPSPEDLESISAAMPRLAGNSPLLLPVGSLPGYGEPAMFDLDGNAAEWATAEDGTGAAVGASADRSTDPRGRAAPAQPEYVGLRVVANREATP